MSEKNIYETFERLGISVDPIPENYTPESFGKMLMNQSPLNFGVSYSASTALEPQGHDCLSYEMK